MTWIFADALKFSGFGIWVEEDWFILFESMFFLTAYSLTLGLEERWQNLRAV